MICGTWRFDHQGRERRGGCRGGGHDSCSSSRGERKLTERATGGAGARFRLGIVHTGATMFGGGIGRGFAGCGRRVFEGVNIGDLDRYGSIGGHGRYNIPDQISVLAEKGRGSGPAARCSCAERIGWETSKRTRPRGCQHKAWESPGNKRGG